MKKLTTQLLLMVSLCMASITAFSQYTVNGTVTDNSGEALIGVNVLVKGDDYGYRHRY